MAATPEPPVSVGVSVTVTLFFVQVDEASSVVTGAVVSTTKLRVSDEPMLFAASVWVATAV